jgi:hypothetical protein
LVLNHRKRYSPYYLSLNLAAMKVVINFHGYLTWVHTYTLKKNFIFTLNHHVLEKYGTV